ncbi:MAG: radical SAM protein [Candidatus Bathyarchaeota archaeon]|nr:radical SAM protein [Candidatus Bathyarchaeota archaeon]
MHLEVAVDRSLCRECNFCRDVSRCVNASCVGCLACYYACPYEARKIVEDDRKRSVVKISVDGVEHSVPEGLTLKEALKLCGYSFDSLHPLCGLGGCWACVVLVDGELTRSCITGVRDGMIIKTDVSGVSPLRIIHGPAPHTVGGKATPWFEARGSDRFIEVAIWTAGCNLRCRSCQNYTVTYDNLSAPYTPYEAARLVTYYRRLYGVNGMAISGGEPTLNRRWLIDYFRELRVLNPDREARLHLDSNGTILTPKYIDELVEAGVNNIGVEPKGLRLETFMNITGITDRRLAELYLKTSWDAVRYLVDNYRDRVYIGVGIPYNRVFMGFDELAEIGYRIASIDPEIQVCILDYFPVFRRRDMKRPSYWEMLKVKKLLNGIGLRCVIVQTVLGHVGP